jgi:translation initiation factor 2B subunit (eIF-2B alpha/beta/delta family)
MNLDLNLVGLHSKPRNGQLISKSGRSLIFSNKKPVLIMKTGFKYKLTGNYF